MLSNHDFGKHSYIMSLYSIQNGGVEAGWHICILHILNLDLGIYTDII